MANFLKNNITYIIALILTIVWSVFSFYAAAVVLKLIEGDTTAIISIYTTVTAVYMTVLNYYFSSSKGSESKQETINTLLNKENK